jgi:hypothetical protein
MIGFIQISLINEVRCIARDHKIFWAHTTTLTFFFFPLTAALSLSFSSTFLFFLMGLPSLSSFLTFLTLLGSLGFFFFSVAGAAAVEGTRDALGFGNAIGTVATDVVAAGGIGKDAAGTEGAGTEGVGTDDNIVAAGAPLGGFMAGAVMGAGGLMDSTAIGATTTGSAGGAGGGAAVLVACGSLVFILICLALSAFDGFKGK